MDKQIKERGIIFNGEMVRSILDGSKTQTRRIITPQPELTVGSGFSWKGALFGAGSDDRETNRNFAHVRCPFGKVGNRLWVRETWARYNIEQTSHDMAYRATTPDDWPMEGRWRPSIHMPRWASRITLEITDIRVERLRDINECGARAEGCKDKKPWTGLDGLIGSGGYTAREKFEELWESIYGQDSWQSNPFVWVVEFKRVEAA